MLINKYKPDSQLRKSLKNAQCSTKGLFIWRRVTQLTELLALPGKTSALFLMKPSYSALNVQYTVVT